MVGVRWVVHCTALTVICLHYSAVRRADVVLMERRCNT